MSADKPWMQTVLMTKAASTSATQQKIDERWRRIEDAAARVVWEIHEDAKMGVRPNLLWIKQHLEEALKP